MSYDFSVYAVAPLAFDELVRLVRSTAGLDGEPGSDADSLMVVRGARRAYCFTIDGPFEVELEDVPEEVTAAVIGAQAVYQVLVEGSEETSIPHAVKFARKLAKSTSGAMRDEQSGDVWPKSKGSRVARPREEARPTELVTVNFYTLMSELPADLPGDYLALARKYLPEALPTRFGTYEPHQGKLERDGDQAFTDAWREGQSGILFFTCEYPLAWGSMEGPQRNKPVVATGFYLDGAALSDAGWLDGLRQFFVAFALESKSFFASVEVLRNYEWGPRSYESLPGAEKEIWPIHVGEWKGLVPYPQAWTWFGPDQISIVSPHLTGHREMHGDHLLHVLAEKPVDRDQLTALLPDPSQPWIPRELATPYAR